MARPTSPLARSTKEESLGTGQSNSAVMSEKQATMLLDIVNHLCVIVKLNQFYSDTIG